MLGLLVILAATLVVFQLPLLPSLQLLAQGAFGDKFAISRTLVKTTPLLLVGLGMAVAWRARMYNIGGEGQYVVGALTGATLAKLMPGLVATPFVGSMVVLLACTLGGALFAGLAGWLSVRRGVDVVIGTILLNFIALQFLSYMVSGPLKEASGQLPLTDPLPAAAMLPRFDRQMDVHLGIVIALICAVGLAVFLFRTAAGFELRVVGDSPTAARANRIGSASIQIRAMLLSGAFCGLAGGVEYAGIAERLGSGFAQQWGFLGIPVALLGGLHPFGVILSATYFGALFAGSENLARFSTAGTTLIYVIQAAAVLGLVGMRTFLNRRPSQEAE
ncbi:MAG: ABC transporter permease [Fimbriimonas sp.]